MDSELSLNEAAEMLGVHYMTAYKYVRTGRLAAHKNGGVWCVLAEDLRVFMDKPAGGDRRETNPTRIESRLLAGDDSGAERILVEAMGSGASVEEAYIDLLSSAMAGIGAKWAAGELSIADEHAATATAMRVISRLGARVAPKGRTRGTIVLSSPANDYHSLPTAILRDLLRNRRYDVRDLGANTPTDSLVSLVNTTTDLLAVGIAATTPDNEVSIRDALTRLAESASVPVVLGGGAIRSQDHARTLGPCVASTSPRHALDLFDEIQASSPDA